MHPTHFRRLCLLLLCTAAALPALAGPRYDLILQYARKIQKTGVWLAPVLPDSFVLARMEAAGKTEQAAAYQEKIAQASTHLQAAFAELWEFCEWKKPEAPPQTWAAYRAWLATLPEGAFVVQFGHAAQFAGARVHHIRAYDRDVFGVWKKDGTTRCVLSTGKLKNAHLEASAWAYTAALQRSLERYARIAKKKGMGPGKAED